MLGGSVGDFHNQAACWYAKLCVERGEARLDVGRGGRGTAAWGGGFDRCLGDRSCGAGGGSSRASCLLPLLTTLRRFAGPPWTTPCQLPRKVSVVRRSSPDCRPAEPGNGDTHRPSPSWFAHPVLNRLRTGKRADVLASRSALSRPPARAPHQDRPKRRATRREEGCEPASRLPPARGEHHAHRLGVHRPTPPSKSPKAKTLRAAGRTALPSARNHTIDSRRSYGTYPAGRRS